MREINIVEKADSSSVLPSPISITTKYADTVVCSVILMCLCRLKTGLSSDALRDQKAN